MRAVLVLFYLIFLNTIVLGYMGATAFVLLCGATLVYLEGKMDRKHRLEIESMK